MGKRFLAAVSLFAVAAIAVAAAFLWETLSGSLPDQDGVVQVIGLEHAAEIERDSLGTPTVRAESRKDIAYATGFVHAQDRFFQMDTLRRRAAGELSELFGPVTLPADREARVHRFRQAAAREFGGLSPQQQSLLQAYAEGVNAGLYRLRSKPFEYYLLGVQPRNWTAQDCLLVVFAMALDLQEPMPGDRQLALYALKNVLPEKAFTFFAPPTSSWDAPLDAEVPVVPPPLPDKAELDLRTANCRVPSGRTVSSGVRGSPLPGGKESGMLPDEAQATARTGSNCWAVPPSRTQLGHAILANDPHMQLRVPNIWYRIAFAWPASDPGRANRVFGVSVPGAPPIVIGSNGHVAWGLTVAYIASDDVVLVETKPGDPGLYRTPNGWTPFETRSEAIKVKGRPPETFTFQTTVWGPVIGKTSDGVVEALHQVMDQEGVVNLNRLGLETAGSAEEALSAAKISGIPTLNCVVADASGKIGWTIMGPIPRRIGSERRLPASWADASQGWDGWYRPEEYPERYGTTFIWNGNNRVVGGADLAKLGDGGYDKGARARQIRDDLQGLRAATLEGMLDTQLDDRAVFLARWHDQLRSTLSKPGALSTPDRVEFRRYLEGWSGRADAPSIAYRLVREYRDEVAARVFEPVAEAARTVYPSFTYTSLKYEDPLWRLVNSQPVNLLNRNYDRWDALFLSAVDAVAARVKAQKQGYSQYTVGNKNATRIQHPFGAVLPMLGPWLNMPVNQLPGDRVDMPRIQGPSFGSSFRMAVSPGHEGEGYFMMPCGESGNPFSPHYRDCHDAWVTNRRTPFLPGAPVHRLSLRP